MKIEDVYIRDRLEAAKKWEDKHAYCATFLGLWCIALAIIYLGNRISESKEKP